MPRTIKKLTVDRELGEGRSMMSPRFVVETEGSDDEIPFDVFPIDADFDIYVRFGPVCVEWWVGHKDHRSVGPFATKMKLRDGTTAAFSRVGHSRAGVVMACTGRDVIDCSRAPGEDIGVKGLLVNDELRAAMRRDCPEVEIGVERMVIGTEEDWWQIKRPGQ